MNNFEKWLEEKKFSEEYHGTDDDMSDAFDDWLGSLDGEDYIKYAEEYGDYMNLKGVDEGKKL